MSSVEEFQFDELFPRSGSPLHLGYSISPADIEGNTEADLGALGDDDDDTVVESTPAFVDEAQASQNLRESVTISSSINVESFTLRHLVGSGTYGKVRQVIKKDTQEVFAMKTLRKKHLIDTNCVENTMAEKDILRKVRHPFIVRLHYAFQTDAKLYLIMDFVNGGHLLHHLRREAMFSEQQARFYIAEVILAIEHLHSLNICHRDLKPENVLLSAEGHCVLTDFGFAKEDVTDPDSCQSFCGTLEYMAPEVIKKNRYGKAADWWSVGILLYDMLNGQPPFRHPNDAKLHAKILKDKLIIPKFLSGPCVDLLRGLLQRDVKKRFTGEKIKNHSFFKSMDWEQLGRLEVPPPFVPRVKRGVMDISNFDREFTKAVAEESPCASPLSNSMQLKFMGFSYARSLDDLRLES